MSSSSLCHFAFRGNDFAMLPFLVLMNDIFDDRILNLQSSSSSSMSVRLKVVVDVMRHILSALRFAVDDADTDLEEGVVLAAEEEGAGSVLVYTHEEEPSKEKPYRQIIPPDSTLLSTAKPAAAVAAVEDSLLFLFTRLVGGCFDSYESDDEIGIATFPWPTTSIAFL